MPKSKGFMESITPINTENQESKHMEMLVGEIYSDKDIELKTDLTQEQIDAVSKMVSFGDYFDIPLLKQYAKDYMKLMISKDRKSRGEFTQIATSANGPQIEDKSTFDKLVNPKL